MSVDGARAAPTLEWIDPPGGQRGGAFSATVHGSELKELTGLWFSGTGVSAIVLPARTGKGAPDPNVERSIKVTLVQDAPLGLQEVRLYDATGLSNPKKIQVGQWPEVREVEPNDKPENAQPISLPVTIDGVIQSGSDQDCFRFHADKGEAIACEVYSERLFSYMGDSWLKGNLEVLNPEGQLVTANDGRFHWDAVTEFTAAKDGDYLVRFRDLLWRGTPSAVYRLTIGPVPYAEAVFPSGGKRGTRANVTFTGINLGPAPSETIEVPADPDLETQDVRLSTPAGVSNSVVFHPDDLPELIEREPNDQVSAAQRIPIPVVINGKVESAGDRDCYRFHAAAKQRLIFEVYSIRGGSPMDPYLTLRNEKGDVLAENDDALDRDPRIDYTFQAAGDNIIEVRDVDDRGGRDFTYRLSVAPPRPDFSVVISPDRIAIPQGGAAPFTVKVDRAWDFGGPVELRAEGLPAGMNAPVFTLPAGAGQVTLALSAPDVSGGAPFVFKMVGSAKIGDRQVQHRSTTVETYNEQGTAYDRKVVGPVIMIVPAGPFSLRAPDAVKLSGAARVDFTVKVARAKGAEGPVKITVDGLPGGVTALPAEIPAGSDETKVTLSAEEDAAGAHAIALIRGVLKTKDGKDTEELAPAMGLEVNEVAAFSLSAAEPTAVVDKDHVVIRLHATRRGGFDGPIALSIEGLGGKFSPTQIDAGKSDADLTLQIARGAVSASKPVVVRVAGTASVGAESRTRKTWPIELRAQS